MNIVNSFPMSWFNILIFTIMQLFRRILNLFLIILYIVGAKMNLSTVLT